MKNFLQQVVAAFLGGLFVAATLVGAILFLIAIFALETVPSTQRAILTLDLSLPITDRGGAQGGLASLGATTGDVPALQECVDALRDAARDEDISALYLCGPVALDWAGSRELRGAIEAFRESHKPILAWFADPGEQELYLGSLADPLIVAPLSLVECNGLVAEALYFHSGLEKLGVEIQVTRVGKYKSAVEPFISDEMSPAEREQTALLLGDVLGVALDEIALARGLGRADLERILGQKGLLLAEEALAEKLVDSVESFDRVLERLRALSQTPDSEPTFRQISIQGYLARGALQAEHTGGNAIAVVYAQGEIVDGENEVECGGDTVARALREARLDPDVRAVVLRVDSPGGSAAASETILAEVRALRAAGKIVVASMGGLAASGGYWISSLADAIVAQPNTITGSIGVWAMFPNAERLIGKLGITRQAVTSGPMSDSFSSLRSKTQAELDLGQRFVDDIYERFLDRVCEGRELERVAVHEIAQGRVWSGKRALELGLVDELGSLGRALELAAEKAGLGANYSVSYPVRTQTKLEAALDFLIEDEDAPIAAVQAWRELAPSLRSLAHWASRGARAQVLARLPFDLRLR